MASGPEVPNISVWPSASARATYSAPMLPPAPARFSTIMGWPRRSFISAASVRAIASVGPPGGKGTTSVKGLVGKASAACAAGTAATSEAHAVSRKMKRFKGCLRFLCDELGKQVQAMASAGRAAAVPFQSAGIASGESGSRGSTRCSSTSCAQRRRGAEPPCAASQAIAMALVQW